MQDLQLSLPTFFPGRLWTQFEPYVFAFVRPDVLIVPRSHSANIAFSRLIHPRCERFRDVCMRSPVAMICRAKLFRFTIRILTCLLAPQNTDRETENNRFVYQQRTSKTRTACCGLQVISPSKTRVLDVTGFYKTEWKTTDFFISARYITSRRQRACLLPVFMTERIVGTWCWDPAVIVLVGKPSVTIWFTLWALETSRTAIKYHHNVISWPLPFFEKLEEKLMEMTGHGWLCI